MSTVSLDATPPTPPTTPTPPSSRLVRDTFTLTGRSLRHVLRSPDTIVTTAITPIAMLLLFVYVLGGSIDVGQGGDRGDYVDYLLPGILLMTVGTGVGYAAFRLYIDVSEGVFERFRTMPIAGPAPLWSHVITSLVANLVSITLVVLVALLMGFRSGAGVVAWLGVLGLVSLFTLAMTWLAMTAGLSAGSVDGVSGFGYPLVFLPFISSAFVPTDGMPTAVRWFAEHQPVTPIVDTLRALLAEQPVGDAGPVAVAWSLGLLVAAYALALRTYRRRTAA